MTCGWLLLVKAEILRVYFIMSFPGNQQGNTTAVAYWLSQNMVWLRLLLLAVIAYPALLLLQQRKGWRTGPLGGGCGNQRGGQGVPPAVDRPPVPGARPGGREARLGYLLHRMPYRTGVQSRVN